jgi:hypothetical protein
MDYNPGMMLWLWLLIAPPLAVWLMSGTRSSRTHSYDETVRSTDVRKT